MTGKTSYIVEAVSRACDVLEAFTRDGEELRLCDVAERAGLSKSTAYRILFTLERRGLIEQTDVRTYRLTIRPLKRHKYRFGYAAQSSEFAFSRSVTEGIQSAALAEGVDLLILNNKYSAGTALRNAGIFVRERVDLVIEFQTEDNCAPAISSKLRDAEIPMIALEIPHPGAVYYGADNYRAGLIGGRYLARWAIQHWSGQAEQVLLLQLSRAGSLPNSRLAGTLAGIRELLPRIRDSQIVTLDGNGQLEKSLDVVRKYLRNNPCKRVLVGAVNDPSAIGAARAFEEAGRAEDCAVMGQNAAMEARSEMRTRGSRLVGSVAYFPEHYGAAVIPLALEILQRKPTPLAVFVKHRLVTPENVHRIYPNEATLEQRSRAPVEAARVS